MLAKTETSQVLLDIARQIDSAHAAVNAAFAAATQHANEAGQLLIEARAKVDHGGWQNWVQSNTTLSARTARAYMQLARRLADASTEERQRVAALPLREALAEIAERVIFDRVGSTITEIGGGTFNVEPTITEHVVPNLKVPFTVETISRSGKIKVHQTVGPMAISSIANRPGDPDQSIELKAEPLGPDKILGLPTVTEDESEAAWRGQFEAMMRNCPSHPTLQWAAQYVQELLD